MVGKLDVRPGAFEEGVGVVLIGKRANNCGFTRVDAKAGGRGEARDDAHGFKEMV